MDRLSLALALVVALGLPTLAGCIEDLERRELDTGWRAELDVDEAPVREVHGAPAMVSAQGTVSLPADVNVTVTGLEGELSRENVSIPLEAMRVRSEAGTQRASEAQGELELEDGENVTVTFVPADGAPLRATPEQTWNASVEVKWRYREGTSFDAGRLEVSRNLTPQPVPDLGVGVVEREEGAVERLVFEAIDVDQLPDRVGVEVLELGGGSVETIETLRTHLSASEGTARVHFAEPISVPEGSGYLVFRLEDVNGTAHTQLRTSEEPIPAPGVLPVFAAVATAVLVAARRRP